jgi:exopolysaccharide biosynthesis protein
MLLFAAAIGAQASPVFGPWTPIFKGIDHVVGTNNPNIAGNFPNEWQVVHCVRVDLTDPDIQLFTTPRASSYAAESRETLTQTVPGILQQYKLQVVSDANFYSANPGGSDPSSAGLSCEVYGLQISKGIVVSAESSADYSGDPRAASLLFTTNKQPMFVFKNLPPGTNTTGIYTAITGYYPIVSNGVNIGAASISGYPDSFIHQTQPRTAFGVSRDGRYLYLLTIDGRQSGYSDGALDSETAYWMLQCGAWNAINMDGGGSTSLYMADSTGSPVALNHSSYLAAYGRERYIGSQFGVYAKPVAAFINDVSANPDDTAATITWTTTDPATSQVQYGLTSNLGSATALQSALVTNHTALLSGLIPGSGYYFKILSTVGSTQFASSNFFLVTTNYLLTNAVFDLTNTWTYTTANLDGVKWTTPTYNDSAWNGSGLGALWVDNRGPNFMGDIPIPLLTEMPLDPNTGYPYHTYYLRTHFTYTNDLPGAALLAEVYLDDGAVVYLNGGEIYRLFMDAYPIPVYNSTLATGYACSGGDASCPVDFVVPAPVLTNLVQGDNLLAVEVHNYNAGSPDITFAMSLAITLPSDLGPELSIVSSNGTPVLSWTRGGFTLQQASNAAGPWTDVPGPVVNSPFRPSVNGSPCYFRLKK